MKSEYLDLEISRYQKLIAAVLPIALASRFAVAKLGLGTASRFALVSSQRSGVRFQVALRTGAMLPAALNRYALSLAAGLGIEPKFSLSESDVLPLDDPAMY